MLLVLLLGLALLLLLVLERVGAGLLVPAAAPLLREALAAEAALERALLGVAAEVLH